MYICICIYIYPHIYIHVHIYIYMYICTCACTHTHAHTHTHTHVNELSSTAVRLALSPAVFHQHTATQCNTPRHTATPYDAISLSHTHTARLEQNFAAKQPSASAPSPSPLPPALALRHAPSAVAPLHELHLAQDKAVFSALQCVPSVLQCIPSVSQSVPSHKLRRAQDKEHHTFQVPAFPGSQQVSLPHIVMSRIQMSRAVQEI